MDVVILQAPSVLLPQRQSLPCTMMPMALYCEGSARKYANFADLPGLLGVA